MTLWEQIIENFISVDLLPGTQPGDLASYLWKFITNGFIVFFSILILIGVFNAFKAGIKFIRSQGDTEAASTHQGNLRSIFVGMFIVLVGLILIVLITGLVTNPLSIQVQQVYCQTVEPFTALDVCISKL